MKSTNLIVIKSILLVILLTLVVSTNLSKKENLSLKNTDKSSLMNEASSYETILSNIKINLNKEKKVNTETETDKKKKKKKLTTKSRVNNLNLQAKKPQQPKNDTLQMSVYRRMNDTYVKKELNQFKNANRKWEHKMLDKQLEDIFQTLNLRDNKHNDIYGDRAYQEIFFDEFVACDSSNDNVLDIKEFETCMKNDTYLKKIVPPSQKYAAQTNYTDTKYFYNFIFNIMDTHRTNSLNFHAYMELRLMIFSWRKCSVQSPFIEETSWECAIEVVAGYKSSSRTTLRNTFYMCLELANSLHIRNIDFISYLIFASSARLYGRINGKEDHDVTKSEFNLILDENMLPARFNQFIVNNFFKLTAEEDHDAQGLDFQTFIYYDFALRLYDLPKATRRWYLNNKEFTEVLSNLLFPRATYNEISKIPMTNFTSDTYQMYTYLNISNFHHEQDFLLKFNQIKETKISKNTKKNKLTMRSRVTDKQIYNLASNAPFYLNYTASRIYKLIDVNSDGLIDWYDFGHFFQTSYLFSKFDTAEKGKITAGELYEKYNSYSEFPRVSAELRHRARRFNLLNQDTYLDVFSVLVILRIDDIVSLYVRKSDISTLYEVELKRVFDKANLRFIPDAHLNKCLREMDHLNVPKYDWECAFMQGIQENINYLESAASYNTAKNNNITLHNTVFYNTDPQLNAKPKK